MSVIVSNIEGSLVTPELRKLIEELYSNIPIGKSPTIKITSDDKVYLNKFIEFIDKELDPDYFYGIGIEKPIFVIDNDNPINIPIKRNFVVIGESSKVETLLTHNNTLEYKDKIFKVKSNLSMQDNLDNIMIHFV